MKNQKNRSVAVVVTIRDSASFLADALQSCMKQRIRPARVLLVASKEKVTARHADRLAALFPEVEMRWLETSDCLSAKRAALATVTSDFVIFLDAGERLTPIAIEAGLQCFTTYPEALVVCGAHRVIDSARRAASPPWRERIDLAGCLKALQVGEAIHLQAALMYRSDPLRACTTFGQGGVQRRADVTRTEGLLASHDYCVAEYHHDRPLMHMRSAVGQAEHALRRPDIGLRPERRLLFHHNAPQLFAAAARELVRTGWNWQIANTMLRAARKAPLALLGSLFSHIADATMRCLPRSIGMLFGEASWAPRVGDIRFGDFDRLTPVSVVDGSDRGKPIDRHYIETALADHSQLVRGRVLEVGGRDYTLSFGAERVQHSDVLDIDPRNPIATIIGDLGVAGSLPSATFDCIILTQTLQFVYHLEVAFTNLYGALAPRGVLLITAPGISPIGKGETPTWYWEFTELALKTMLIGRFGERNVTLRSYGNVFAAISFLTGLSLKEVGVERLTYKDERYPVTIFACARKGE
jgi:hypothetical protein